MVKLFCKICKIPFFVSPCRVGKLICCSKPCSNLLKKTTQKGENNSFYGKKHSKESIEKNSIANLGKTPWNKGKRGIYSSETIKKMSIAGKKNTGTNHNQWKGGIRNHNGYIMLYSPTHPFKDKNNLVYEHRLIMEKHLKRFLKPEEVIHHKNYIKSDNRIENLILFSSNKDHLLFHGKEKSIKGRPKIKPNP